MFARGKRVLLRANRLKRQYMRDAWTRHQESIYTGSHTLYSAGVFALGAPRERLWRLPVTGQPSVCRYICFSTCTCIGRNACNARFFFYRKFLILDRGKGQWDCCLKLWKILFDDLILG